MFEAEKNGYKRSEVDHYIKRLDDDFQKILGRSEERLENVKHNIAALTVELNEYSQVVPQYKSEIESLRERLNNIRKWANNASEARYLKKDVDAILASFITQSLAETDKLDELKPLDSQITQASGETRMLKPDDFFEVLATNKNLKLDEALSGFDFFDNNPFRQKAEKRLKKIENKRNKRANR